MVVDRSEVAEVLGNHLIVRWATQCEQVGLAASFVDRSRTELIDSI